MSSERLCNLPILLIFQASLEFTYIPNDVSLCSVTALSISIVFYWHISYKLQHQINYVMISIV